MIDLYGSVKDNFGILKRFDQEKDRIIEVIETQQGK